MKREQQLVSFFLIVMAIFPIIDVLNGYALTMHYSLPIGVAYRMGCFVFLVGSILAYGFKKSIYTLLTLWTIFSCTLLLLLQSMVLSHTPTIIFQDSVVLIKLYLWLLIPYFIYQHQTVLRSLNYEKLFIVISFLFTIGLLIPYFMNIGNQTYENSDAGYKGFYFATNDTTLAFIVSSTFTGNYLVKKIGEHTKIKTLSLIILYFCNMVCLLLLATKTGIFYGAILTIVLVVYFLFFQKKISKNSRILTSLVVAVLTVFIVVMGSEFILTATAGTINRITYFYHLFDGDLVRLLTSSRSEYLQGGWGYFSQSQHPFLIPLIGFGFEYRLLHFGRVGLIEMDFFDLLFSFGFIGVVVVTIMISYFFILALNKRGKSIYSIVYVVLLGYGFFAGHVFFSALSTTILGLVCGGIILKYGERET
ncbi:O-antigen ligase family protein [Carnobacterium divergens]|uniref:O-antigen ligase family protein n=1 Tax=Carnobacterium divergens TaxID=2748 RepID=A0AAW8RH54_CARDV|nr:O-antigen ligase family protein [Carnobacterium divergens]MDT1959018.1 O-antigen ligase family protein [Carnobacterium divergens]MDT1974986.1 O-antigen ligase family protein [Carnobacterium divergens]MDT2012950.1 O-antigen ligase family protein [Carnobacterium divergens]